VSCEVNVDYHSVMYVVLFFNGLLTLVIMPNIIQCMYTYCIR